ncbi:hypothetical protein GGS21DRAFT_488277 [Xylaria nigripes]|nr:hypothetical protein GGS21DRAFT_488277 [Xylaria nigripes]
MPENPTTQETGKSQDNTQSTSESDLGKLSFFAAHKAAPGPVVPQSMPEQEGTKEERAAKAKELNK